MSEKDKIIQLLDYVPEYKLGYVSDGYKKI